MKRTLAAFALLASLAALASCSGKLDETFPWGPGGAPFDPEASIQDLLASGGGYAGSANYGQETEVVVVDFLTGNPLPGATVVVGWPPGDYRVFYPDGAGRVLYARDGSWGGVDERIVTAACAGYETLTVDHYLSYGSFHPAVYVLPLRPNTSAAYARLHAQVAGLSTSDHRKFEASYTHTSIPFYTPLDQEGFSQNDAGVFFGPPNRSGTCAALELSGDRAGRIVLYGTTGVSAGATEAPSLDASSGMSSPIALGGGSDFYLQGPYNNVVQEACRARTLAFFDGAPQPLIAGSNPVDTGMMRFRMDAFAVPNATRHRGLVHFEHQPGVADIYWDLPLDLGAAGSATIDLPPHPDLVNPPNGRKLASATEQLQFNWPQSTSVGLFEIAIRDPLKAYPENLVWRFWKGAWSYDLGYFAVGGLRLGSLPTGDFDLRPEREYIWRVIRHEDPTFAKGRTCRYGMIPRNARYSSSSPWRRFTIGIDGQAGATAVDAVLEDLRSRGGGAAGILWHDNAVSMKVLVFDEATGWPIPGADVFLENVPATWAGATDGSGRITFQMPSVHVVTACHAGGYENTTFYSFNGHVLAIPLRPLPSNRWPHLAGTIGNLSGSGAVKGAVSVLQSTLRGPWWLTAAASEPYTLPALPNKPLAMTAFLQDGGHFTEFHWLAAPTLPGVGPTSFDFSFSGVSTHPFARLDAGATGQAPKPWNLVNATDAKAWVQGKGLDPALGWKSVTVGCGDANLGSQQYSLDAAKVPQVRGLRGCVSYSGLEGSSEARFGIQSLARSLPSVSFPDLPLLTYPGDFATVSRSGPYLEFYAGSSDETTSGPCVLSIEDPAYAPPLCFRWRVFKFPESSSNTGFYLPALPSAYIAFELNPGTNYRWFVTRYQGSYSLRDPSQSQYADLGKFSMAWLEEFLAFKSDSAPRTFTTNPS
jgi:hypothetical protein